MLINLTEKGIEDSKYEKIWNNVYFLCSTTNQCL